METETQFETVIEGEKLVVTVAENVVIRPTVPIEGEWYFKEGKLVKA